MLPVLASLALTIGLLLLGLRLLRGLAPGALRRHCDVPLALLKRIPVGPRQSVAVVRVADRVLVVAIGDSGGSLLAELDGPDRTLALRDDAEARGRSPRPAWRAWLPVAALLLAAPATLAAQAAPAPRPAVAPAAATSPAAELPLVPGMPQIDLTVGTGADRIQLSGAVGIVVLMGVLTLLPALFLLTTSFTRILVVLHFLRMALGTQTAPPGQLLVALAVLMSSIVMGPALNEANRTALQPYRAGTITQVEAYRAAAVPFRRFMLANTRENSLAVFAEIAGADSVRSPDDLPITVIMTAFVTSELTTAFQIGFMIFLPFVVIDLLVGAVLVSMGMFMLPPVMVSLPFKLLLFVLADGWTLIVQNLVLSFRH
jgi:flagellar biosynthetic protein FliP